MMQTVATVVGLAGTKLAFGRRAGRSAGEIAEDRGTGPDHQPQGLVVLFRELSVCGAVEDGS